MAPDTAHRIQLRNRYRRTASWFLCLMQLALAILHLYPPLAYRSVNATTTRVVAWVNSLGGIWVLGLGLTAMTLGASLLFWNKLRAHAHLACAAATVTYDVQLWIGSLGERPFGPITYPLSFVLFVVGHLLLFFSYDGGD